MQASHLRARLVAALLFTVVFPLSAHALGNPTLPANPCLAGKIKCVTKRTSCLVNCYAKAAKSGLALNNTTDGCLNKCRDKYDGGPSGTSCFGKLETKGGCIKLGDAIRIGVKSDVFVSNVVAKLDPAPLDDASSCRSGKLKCVAKYDKCVQGLFSKAAKTGGQIDAGKLGKCLAVITGGTKGLSGSCFGKLEAKGDCETTGDGGILKAQDDAHIDDVLAAMAVGPLDVHNERCTGDTAVKCSSAPGGTVGCGGPLGTCEFYFGSPQPLAVGGVSVCSTNRWLGAVVGTLNQQTGASAWNGALFSNIYLASLVDAPCPKCVDDVTPNDGVAEGTCSHGAHSGGACDANGTTSVAAFGATSLDCPPTTLIASEIIGVNASNGAESLTLSGASPACNDPIALGKVCACGSCSLDPTTACKNNADCAIAAVGTCTNSAGAQRSPNACDDTLCVDTPPVGDGGGICSAGPFDTVCAIESFRSCIFDSDCPAPGDSCVVRPRPCYLDNGVVGGMITAVGGHSSPVDHAVYSTFASVRCLAPTTSSAANVAFGLPGAGRLAIGGELSENGTDVACPSRASFTVTDADGVQDLGWTGLGHQQRYVTQAKLSVSVTGCSGPAPVCGICNFSGPVLNPGAVLPPAKRVFVTSTTTSGNMGNLAGADAICQSLAGTAGLTGTFKAWLSSAAASAASRLTHAVDDYALVDGTVIADGWADLTDGTLDAPINKDENGATVSAAVWTNATINGAIDAAECLQWTSITPGHKGQTGLSSATNAAWTENIDFEDCALQRHLYCFEQ